MPDLDHDTPPAPSTIRALVRAHAALLLDAYGVLVDSHGALAGAPELIADLNRAATPYLVVTNDASRLPETAAARFRRLGLDIPRERILSSGDLIAPYFAAHGLRGARCVVLGTDDSRAYVARAGGALVALDAADDLDALVLCDESGTPTLGAIDAALSLLVRAFDRGRRPLLLLPNPDLIYPKSAGEFGVAAGAVAHVFEAALALRFAGEPAPRFVCLGKPHAPIYARACEVLGTRDAVMVGDQLATDVRGARDFGLAAALVGTGLTAFGHIARGQARPTYLVPDLRG